MNRNLANVPNTTSSSGRGGVTIPESCLFRLTARLIVPIESPVGTTISESNVFHTDGVTVPGIEPISAVLDRKVRDLNIFEISEVKNICMSVMK